VELNLESHRTHVPPNRTTKFFHVLVHGTTLAPVKRELLMPP
jgi:hypothetical protein